MAKKNKWSFEDNTLEASNMNNPRDPSKNPVGKNPAWTGDWLFHMRVNEVLKDAHRYNALGDGYIMNYCDSIFNFYSEINARIDQEKSKELAERLNITRSNIMMTAESGERKYLLFGVKMQLHKILAELQYEAHKAKIMLKDRENKAVPTLFEDLDTGD
jgi:hypothetical protein